MAQPTVLLYNLDDSTEQGRAVRRVCRVQKLRVRGVLPTEQKKTLDALLTGREEPSAAAQQSFSAPMLVMADLSNAQFRRLLQGLRPLPTIALKAVLTSQNRFWTGIQLYEELQREHAAFHPEKEDDAP